MAWRSLMEITPITAARLVGDAPRFMGRTLPV
jgi:hypothetical protein